MLGWTVAVCTPSLSRLVLEGVAPGTEVSFAGIGDKPAGFTVSLILILVIYIFEVSACVCLFVYACYQVMVSYLFNFLFIKIFIFRLHNPSYLRISLYKI